MSIKDAIKKLPDGRLLHLEHFPVPDDYRGRKTDDLKALAESHDRLLEAAKIFCDFNLHALGQVPQALVDAIEEAEKL